MKKGIFILMFLTVAIFASDVLKGSDPVKETRNLSGFKTVGFGVAGDLYINIGPEFKVVLEGEKSVLADIKTEVSGSKLIIKKDSWHTFDNGKITVWITMPSLEGLGVSGSGKAEIRDDIKGNDLDLSVSGSGRISTSDLTLGRMDVSISGSGDVYTGGGDVKKADISISGSGNYNGETLRIAEADFSISGSGGAKCDVTDNLEAHVSGSGSVIYSGSPKVDARVSGSGRVRSK
jgi:hypothetical protein